MEEKKEKTWAEAIGELLSKTETENINLGMEIEKIRNSFFYKKVIKFLKGDDSDNGSMYFCELKPIYDKYGYEKVNRILLALEAEQGGKENE